MAAHGEVSWSWMLGGVAVVLLASPLLALVLVIGAVVGVLVLGALCVAQAMEAIMGVAVKRRVEFVGGPWDGIVLELREPSERVRVKHEDREHQSVYVLREDSYLHERVER